MSSLSLVLITGANGFVGYAVLTGVLRAKVRGFHKTYFSGNVSVGVFGKRQIYSYTTNCSIEFGRSSAVKMPLMLSQGVLPFRITCPLEL